MDASDLWEPQTSVSQDVCPLCGLVGNSAREESLRINLEGVRFPTFYVALSLSHSLQPLNEWNWTRFRGLFSPGLTPFHNELRRRTDWWLKGTRVLFSGRVTTPGRWDGTGSDGHTGTTFCFSDDWGGAVGRRLLAPLDSPSVSLAPCCCPGSSTSFPCLSLHCGGGSHVWLASEEIWTSLPPPQLPFTCCLDSNQKRGLHTVSTVEKVTHFSGPFQNSHCAFVAQGQWVNLALESSKNSIYKHSHRGQIRTAEKYCFKYNVQFLKWDFIPCSYSVATRERILISHSSGPPIHFIYGARTKGQAVLTV